MGVQLNQVLHILYYPEHSDYLTFPTRNATNSHAWGTVSLYAYANLNSLIVVEPPQRIWVTVIFGW
jgi:hypothetical protein